MVSNVTESEGFITLVAQFVAALERDLLVNLTTQDLEARGEYCVSGYADDACRIIKES